MRVRFPAAACLTAALLALLYSPALMNIARAAEQPPGLGDPGQLVSLAAETGREVEGRFRIAGRDAGQQLIVTGHYETGQLRDLTRAVSYLSTPAGIVEVDDTGFVRPLSEGQATIIARTEQGQECSTVVEVTHIEQDLPINFSNQIVPIFTKYGCNGGGCHGKSGGQNGFRLSLLGFEPSEDFEYLVKEARGRRLFPAAPERSLLLVKATSEVPHGGGHRIDIDSPAYNLLRRWIAQGMPYGNADDPVVTHIQVLPEQRRLGQHGSQQLTVVAFYNDGSTEDVTRMTQFESNDPEMAECSVTGLVTTADLTGSVAIMARYQGHVGVFRATVPLGIEIPQLPESSNFIDDLVFEKLKSLGLPPSDLCDDSTYLRRVTIDLAGRLPTLEETREFLADTDPNKRDKLLERLLNSTDYAEFFANKWNAILRNKRRQPTDRPATFAFHDWIRESLYENKPYDQFVREIITASGEPGKSPPAAWYREVNELSAQVEDTAQLFLGLRIQCARCHHHPFEKWSQQDYYGLAAFFSRVGRKKGEMPGASRIFHQHGVAQTPNPKTGQNVLPTGLGGEPMQIAAHEDPRQYLVEWMVAKENPFFARALVNRYWKHFFGRGLVDPEDDMRVTNPASNPELLDRLSSDFVEHGYDLKHLVRTICSSKVYQLSSEPNEWNQNDKQNFSRYYPKRLNAEVLLDAIDQVTASTTNFGEVPVGTRAVELPDNGFNSYFLTVFGRPEGSSACECERSSEANLAQSLHLLNSSEIQGKLTAGNARPALLSGDAQRDHEAKLRELYLLAFSREPSAEELKIALAHLEKTGNDRQAYEDIVWALINTKEFLFSH